jgi:Ca-activated chloride channel family protein
MDWQSFHFLRPEWLLLLLPAAAVVTSILLRQDPRRAWRQVIAPPLLEHLALRRESRSAGLRPVVLVAVIWLLGIIALAGPAWEKEPTPFTEDQSALFIVLEVTPGMLAQDIQPSRLQRAAQKISDLLALRPGAKTGLIAYAGSAHLVMPLTADPDIIRYFAAELRPDVMPLAGDDPVAAVELARERLQASGLPGSVVLLTDGVDAAAGAALEQGRKRGGADVHILAVAAGPEVVPPTDSPPAPALDRESLQQTARAGGGRLAVVTPDDADVRSLAAGIERSIAAAPVLEGERWKDAGYYLLLLFAALVLLLFRPGGAVALQT